MKRLLLLLTGGMIAASAAPAAAQQGFALKGHYILNSSTASDARQDRQIPTADGLGLGAELVLPFGLGVGVSGFTAGGAGDLGIETTELTVLGEANYFLRLPLLPVAPYAGVHAGLGVLNRDNVSDPKFQIGDRTRSQLGYQLGVRFQPTRMLGIDAQWRRMSTSAAEGQDGSLERNQVLLGITLF
jgi:opacity protein-like surface antigen